MDGTPRQADWLTMGEAMAALKQVGKEPEDAAALLKGQLTSGLLLSRAANIHTEYSDGTTTDHADSLVPTFLWENCPFPPLGHEFWLTGDLQFLPQEIPPTFDYRIGPYSVGDLPLGGLLPGVTLRGAKVSPDGVMALCRAIGGARGRGRRKGVGGLAVADEPLVLEMQTLLSAGEAGTVYQAALALADKAKGGGQLEARVKRLVRRFKERFPGADIN